MNYNVKLTPEATKQLKEVIGFNAEKINLNKGLIGVSSEKDVQEIAKRFKFQVENVNFQPYEKVVKPIKIFSLEERRKIIGNTIDIGIIVTIDLGEGVEHFVIIGIDGDNYIGAKILLETSNETSNRIPILKNIDVIYRNLTYKSIVTIINQVTYTLKSYNFKGVIGHVLALVLVIYFIPLVTLVICLALDSILVGPIILMILGSTVFVINKIVIPVSESKHIQLIEKYYGKDSEYAKFLIEKQQKRQ